MADVVRALDDSRETPHETPPRATDAEPALSVAALSVAALPSAKRSADPEQE